MCGIAGFFRPDGRDAGFDRKKVLDEMLKVIDYRGPDDQGEFSDDNIAFGMRRLSIIDLSTGHQPLFNEDASLVLVCNGEIYNFQEKRDELEKSGHKFRTKSDVEVILHLYEQYGESLFEHIEGMFGFALWDSKKQKLILGRDRMGIKPLFWYEKDGIIAFGSEIKSILRIPGIDRTINPESLSDYFSYNYIPAPGTIYKHVRKLLPGCYLSADKKGIKTSCYWNIDPNQTDGGKSEEEWSRIVWETFLQSVKSHLISDVPLGVFLSGGIDSAAIVAAMKKLGVQARTFSIGFREKSYNEMDYARQAAAEYDCIHHDELVLPDAVSLMQNLHRHFDEPFADSSALPVYLVSKLASSKVKVVLSGEGGDEIFAGYFTYQADLLAETYNKIPCFLRKNIIPSLINILPVSTDKVSVDYLARRFVRGAEEDNPAVRHYLWKVIFDASQKSSLFSRDFAAEAFDRKSESIFTDYYKPAGRKNILNNILYVDSKVYLPDDLLVKADRMSMANSIEARVPFLDRKMVELAFSIPDSLKLKGRKKKYILKKALKGIVSDEILTRKKAGFSIPAARWFKEDLKEFAEEILSPESVRKTGILNPDHVKKVWSDHQNSREENSRQLWGLMMFMLWYNDQGISR
ncbi:MAG: asparagine synthase (glutamine-hydrolyzing) [Firmicutes bacterium]|nr:asparagine synthase (glutamine-hydrolyzing) [Bacillota bacterium]